MRQMAHVSGQQKVEWEVDNSEILETLPSRVTVLCLTASVGSYLLSSEL